MSVEEGCAREGGLFFSPHLVRARYPFVAVRAYGLHCSFPPGGAVRRVRRKRADKNLNLQILVVRRDSALAQRTIARVVAAAGGASAGIVGAFRL